ncbi:MAG TPA: hypothetical protein VNB23_03450 [Ramlibacter sp.]|nr:hypothetical protein [Ramlibacter sp.]
MDSSPGTADTGAYALIDALSQRMMRHGDIDAWRSLFLGPRYDSIRFDTMELSIVAADAPQERITDDERMALGTRFDGMMQPSRKVDLILCFKDPAKGLKAAMALQRLGGSRKVRTSLTTASCTLAFFRGERGDECLLIGAGIEQAEQALAAAPRGTVAVCGRTYALLGDGLGQHVQDALVMTEHDEETVTGASITLAPTQSAALSTFAGLGLT